MQQAIKDNPMKDNGFTILLVDDEPDILEIISYNLKGQGYRIHTAQNGREAVEKAKKIKPHLILLDVMMPELDGIAACKKLRQHEDLSETLIAFLTARGEDFSQVAGLDAGADDYITKPIRPKVLVSRVKALLRRTQLPSASETLRFPDLEIIPEEHKVVFKEEELFLPKKEFELLLLLASSPGKVFGRETILDQIWGPEVIVGDRTIDVHIRKLREKLGDAMFKTIKGVGYKFDK